MVPVTVWVNRVCDWIASAPRCRYPSRAAPPFGGRTVHTLSSRSILSKPTSLIKFSELQPESGAEEGVVGAGTVIVSATAGRMWESHIKWLRAIIFV